jgi:hypothetical protein
VSTIDFAAMGYTMNIVTHWFIAPMARARVL